MRERGRGTELLNCSPKVRWVREDGREVMLQLNEAPKTRWVRDGGSLEAD